MAELGTFAPIIAGGGIADNVFSYSNPTLTVGTAGYPVTRLVFLSATATIGMGASPGSTAAFNIDGASYAGIGYRQIHGTADFRVTTTNNSFTTIGTESGSFVLRGAGGDAWSTSGSGAVTLLVAQQVTVRIRGGSSNGIAFQNSGATRDNGVLADAGTSWSVDDGTRSSRMWQSATSGEMTAGARFSAVGAYGTWLAPNNGTAAILTGVQYYNGGYVSALEVANIASGFGTLVLMKSGGRVTIGVGSAAITANNPYLVTSQTWNSAGVTFTGVEFSVVNTASAAASLLFNLLAGAGGATSVFSVRVDGRIVTAAAIEAGATFAFYWNGRSSYTSPADGQINWTNNAASAGVGFDFATDAILKIRTRAQSAYATIDALAYRASGVAGVDFGPGLPTSLTIVKGIVTAAT